jgi:hypothetical protein
MNEKRIILGVGQCGMKLANKFFHTYKGSEGLINLSTSIEDSVGIPTTGLVQVSKSGSGKKFSRGLSIWKENNDELEKQLRKVKNSDVIYFSSAGGGSGSSSIKYVSDVLLKNNNRVFLVLVLPFDHENLPYKPNALQSLSKLQDEGYTSKISVLIFDNDKLGKQYYDTEYSEDGKEIKRPNLESINNHIISITDIVIDMVEKYHIKDKYSPFSIDALEHESVIFSNGILGVDFKKYDNGPTNVKFDYGKLKDCKNVIIARAVNLHTSDYHIDQSTTMFIDIVKKISRKSKNARIISGIIRTNQIDDGTYIIIGNNLDISKYIERTKNKIGTSIEGYKHTDEKVKVLDEKEHETYDI